jgi:hypothetical protein
MTHIPYEVTVDHLVNIHLYLYRELDRGRLGNDVLATPDPKSEVYLEPRVARFNLSDERFANMRTVELV